MEFKTKHLGVISYREEEIVHFPEGLFGFEHLYDYVPLSFHSDADSMLSLQSTTDEDIAFILMNPFYLSSQYAPLLQPSDLAAIGSPEEADISYYVICVVKDDLRKSTVNLKCPIIINTVTRCAKQVILNSPDYSFRHLLTDITQKEE